MGMYDDIDYQANCLSCGEALTSFQSKDGPCEQKKLNPSDVKHFYDLCEKCDAWNEFEVVTLTYAINRRTRVGRGADGKWIEYKPDSVKP